MEGKGDAMYVGASDRHPSQLAKIGRLARVTGLVFLVTLTAACAPQQSSTDYIKALATDESEMGPKSDLALVSPAVRQHTVRITNLGNLSATMSGYGSSSTYGMGVIVNESHTPTSSTEDIATISHVESTPDTSIYRDVMILNAFAQWLPKIINPSEPSLNDWNIKKIFNPADNPGITVISLTNSDPSAAFTDGSTIKINTTPMNEGDEIVVVESSQAINNNTLAATMKIAKVDRDENGDIAMYTVDGPGDFGTSGGPVLNIFGQLIGVIYGAPIDNPNQLLIVPFHNSSLVNQMNQ